MKGWRTITTNVLMFLIFVAGWEPLTQWVDPQILAGFVTLANIALRLFTTGPVGSKQ